MKLIASIYKLSGRPVPYYANYSLLKIIWIPIRKYLNVVLIPNVPFSGLRVSLYRMLGYKIGKSVFIGMKCYMDDLEPSNTVIGSNVTISYGCYFSLHGKGQGKTKIEINNGSYIGMRSTLMAKKNGLTIGENAIIGAGSVVVKDVAPNTTVVGVPAKVV